MFVVTAVEIYPIVQSTSTNLENATKAGNRNYSEPEQKKHCGLWNLLVPHLTHLLLTDKDTLSIFHLVKIATKSLSSTNLPRWKKTKSGQHCIQWTGSV